MLCIFHVLVNVHTHFLGLYPVFRMVFFGTKPCTCVIRRIGLKNLHCSSPRLLTRLGILGSIEGDQVRFRPASRNSTVAHPFPTYRDSQPLMKPGHIFWGIFWGLLIGHCIERKDLALACQSCCGLMVKLHSLALRFIQKLKDWKMKTCGPGFPRPQIKKVFWGVAW